MTQGWTPLPHGTVAAALDVSAATHVHSSTSITVAAAAEGVNVTGVPASTGPGGSAVSVSSADGAVSGS